MKTFGDRVVIGVLIGDLWGFNKGFHRGCTSYSSRSGLPPWHPKCNGSSSNDVAKARCAAAVRMPLQSCVPSRRRDGAWPNTIAKK